MEAEQYDQALAEFQAIGTEFATVADISGLAQYYIGITHQELNNLDPAVSAYQKALALKAPQEVHGNVHLHLGIVYKAQGKLVLAENHLKQAHTLLKETAEAHIHLGDVYILQRRFNAAEKAYREGTPPEPRPYRILLRIGQSRGDTEPFPAGYGILRCSTRAKPIFIADAL